MKTDVIHLEPFDDIDSIRERLEWSKAGRVVLVWPKRSEISFTHLEMVFLVRKALQLNKQLAIVNDEGAINDLAISAGIPVFYSQASATLARWPKLRAEDLDREEIARVNRANLAALSEKVETLRTEPPRRPFVRTLALISSAAALCALVLFFLPGATIEIFPAEIDQNLRLTIQASPSIQEADMAGNVPLHSLTSLQKASDKIETSGQLLTPDQYARGQVTLQNLTDKAISIPPGAVVTTLGNPPVRFETLAAVDVPPDGADSTVEVRAVQPGSSGNIFEGEIQSLEGPAGLNIKVANEEAFSGGSESSLRSPSDDDVATLREKVKSMLLAQARQDFLQTKSEDAGGQKFLDETIKIEKVVDEEISTPAGKPADTLEISLSGEVRMEYVREDEVKAALAAAMNASLPDGFEPVNGELRLKSSGEPVYDPDALIVKWEVDGARKLRSTYSARAIVRAVTGQTPAQAVQALAGLLKHRAVPQVHMTPSWWPRLPFLPFRIEVASD